MPMTLSLRPTTAAWPQRRLHAAGVDLAFVDEGDGPPVVFLHGNPTSSYLWRNVMPHVAGLGRLVAPDLAGMGNSGPMPDGEYRLADHRRVLDAFLAAAGADRDVVLVVHDWGSVLGFDWARRHPDRIRGIAYMEAIVKPFTADDFTDGGELVRLVRGADGERIVLEENVFIEQFLPAGVLRDLEPEELIAYQAPFRAPESRRPSLAWARELPFDGRPVDVVETVKANAAWLGQTLVPKLFIDADPGQFLTGTARDLCRTWPAQQEVRVPGTHFVQEDAPDAIGTALAEWLRELPR